MEIQEVVNWNVITVRVAILLWTDVTHATISSLSFALKPIGEGVAQPHMAWCRLKEPKRWDLWLQKNSVVVRNMIELLKLFCETCNEAICRDCIIVKHWEHHYTFVKDAFAKNKKSVVEILSKTKGQAGSLKKAIDGVLEMKRSVDSNAEQTVQEVLNCFQKLSARLNACCEELIHDVEELKKVKQKSLEIQRE